MFLYEVIDAFENNKLPYALVGGFALALQGIVRATVDIDIVINLRLADYESAERVLIDLGLSPRLPIRGHEVFKMRKEYIEQRNLIAWSFVDHKNPSRLVDVIITHDRKDLEIQKIGVAGRRISVATLRELMRMKSAAGRPQDLIDVDRIQRVLDGKD